MRPQPCFLEAKNCKCSCLLVSYWGTDIAVICSALRIPWHVPYERPNLPAKYEILPHELSLTILWTFFMFLSVSPENSQTSTEVLHISIEKTTQKPVLPLGLVNETCFYRFTHFQWTLLCSKQHKCPLPSDQKLNNYTSQQDFGTRKVYCVSNVTFHAESNYAIKIFPSPTVFVQWPFKLLIFWNFWYFHQWFFYTWTNILNDFEQRVVTYSLPLSYL